MMLELKERRHYVQLMVLREEKIIKVTTECRNYQQSGDQMSQVYSQRSRCIIAGLHIEVSFIGFYNLRLHALTSCYYKRDKCLRGTRLSIQILGINYLTSLLYASYFKTTFATINKQVLYSVSISLYRDTRALSACSPILTFKEIR